MGANKHHARPVIPEVLIQCCEPLTEANDSALLGLWVSEIGFVLGRRHRLKKLLGQCARSVSGCPLAAARWVKFRGDAHGPEGEAKLGHPA